VLQDRRLDPPDLPPSPFSFSSFPPPSDSDCTAPSSTSVHFHLPFLFSGLQQTRQQAIALMGGFSPFFFFSPSPILSIEDIEHNKGRASRRYFQSF